MTLHPGDRVEIISTSAKDRAGRRIGQTATVIREGSNRFVWIKADTGEELCWRGAWLKKLKTEAALVGMGGFDEHTNIST